MLAFVFSWGCLAGAANSVWGLPQDDEDDSAVEVSELDDESPAGGIIDFARDVSPILADKCLECHGPLAQLAAMTMELALNPHISHIPDLQCTDCHHAHREQENACLDCH